MKKHFLIEFSCKSITWSIEALMEEMKTLVTKKDDFEYRDESIIIPSFIFWDFTAFDPKNKLNELAFKSLFLSVDFSIGTLLKEIKPIVTEKNEYKNRNISILIAIFGIF